MEVNCVNISQISKSHEVPLDILASVHLQIWHVSINEAIYCVHLVTFLESSVTLKLVDGAWVWAVFIDVVIKVPASIFVECGKQEKELAVHITARIIVFQCTLIISNNSCDQVS